MQGTINIKKLLPFNSYHRTESAILPVHRSRSQHNATKRVEYDFQRQMWNNKILAVHGG